MSVVRELRVTDIGCRECCAASGDPCVARDGSGALVLIHPSRHAEFKKLKAEGWDWQEVHRLDLGADRDANTKRRSGAR